MSTKLERRVLLLSVKPEFVEAMRSGRKTVEFRRIAPVGVTGMGVLIYSSSPVCELSMFGCVDAIERRSVAATWRRHGACGAIDRARFDLYFDGTLHSAALVLSSLAELSTRLSLAELRRVLPGFHPPQSFRYASESEVDRLGLTESEREILYRTIEAPTFAT